MWAALDIFGLQGWTDWIHAPVEAPCDGGGVGGLHPFRFRVRLFNPPSPPRFFLLSWSSPGVEGRCLHGNLWYSPPTSVTSRLTSVTFKIASKVFIEETDKNFDLITEILIRFLGFGDFKVPIVIEN